MEDDAGVEERGGLERIFGAAIATNQHPARVGQIMGEPQSFGDLVETAQQQGGHLAMACAQPVEDRIDQRACLGVVQRQQPVDDTITARRPFHGEGAGILWQEGADHGALGIGQQGGLEMANERGGQVILLTVRLDYARSSEGVLAEDGRLVRKCCLPGLGMHATVFRQANLAMPIWPAGSPSGADRRRRCCSRRRARSRSRSAQRWRAAPGGRVRRRAAPPRGTGVSAR